MIINTGQRTDIPAFYTPWFLRRLEEGYVLVRNPFNPRQITRYRLSPEVVDCIGFITKNPGPMLPHLDALAPYGQLWHVTITPYGREIEPNVPPKEQVMADFRRLSDRLGPDCVVWRYDPILLTDAYTAQRHLMDFAEMCRTLAGATHICVISFVDLYEKVKRNFPEVRAVSQEMRLLLGREMAAIAREYGMTLTACHEGEELAAFGVDCAGCMTLSSYEKAIGAALAPRVKQPRARDCACHLTCDIGSYDTCGHLCRYCYANASPEAVRRSMAQHDPLSPLLTGHVQPGDRIHEARQESWRDGQISLSDWLG